MESRAGTKPLSGMIFERFIVVRNPVSTRARRAVKRIAEIRRMAPHAELIEIQTGPGGRAANHDILRPYADKLGPQTLLCVVTGDGTVSLVVDILLSDPELPKRARLTPVLPLWGGNANDLAHILNGSALRSLRTLLRQGQVIPIRPMQADITTSDGVHDTRPAVCYASFGASAFSARVLGRRIRAPHPMDRLYGVRLLRELIYVSTALIRAPLFVIEEAGLRRTVYETVFVNGSRLAKIIDIPLRITDNAFRRATIERKHFWSFVSCVMQLTSRKYASQLQGHEAAFTVRKATWAQFDGETVRIPAGTDVRMTIASQPLYVLASDRSLIDG